MDRLLNHWKIYKATLELSSPFASEWQADTIWGHLCWILRFIDGERALSEFLSSYESDNPLLLVSNGFPGDLLPRPILPARSVENRADFKKIKDQKHIKWLDLDEFNKTLNGQIPTLSEKKNTTANITLKNQINRFTATTAGEDTESGRLYSFKEYFGDTISIYLKISDGFVNTTKELFQNLSKSGYGKRKTVGYGQFSIKSFEEFREFEPPQEANGFVSLSNFVPSVNDPTSGYWDVLIKYGRLGEEYAITGSPHKKPLMMFKAGSCFYDNTFKDYYGRLIKGLSEHYLNVVQYGFALPLPLKYPQI